MTSLSDREASVLCKELAHRYGTDDNGLLAAALLAWKLGDSDRDVVMVLVQDELGVHYAVADSSSLTVWDPVLSGLPTKQHPIPKAQHKGTDYAVIDQLGIVGRDELISAFAARWAPALLVNNQHQGRLEQELLSLKVYDVLVTREALQEAWAQGNPVDRFQPPVLSSLLEAAEAPAADLPKAGPELSLS